MGPVQTFFGKKEKEKSKDIEMDNLGNGQLLEKENPGDEDSMERDRKEKR